MDAFSPQTHLSKPLKSRTVANENFCDTTERASQRLTPARIKGEILLHHRSGDRPLDPTTLLGLQETTRKRRIRWATRKFDEKIGPWRHRRPHLLICRLDARRNQKKRGASVVLLLGLKENRTKTIWKESLLPAWSKTSHWTSISS